VPFADHNLGVAFEAGFEFRQIDRCHALLCLCGSRHRNIPRARGSQSESSGT
jgi:hypothetical protein